MTQPLSSAIDRAINSNLLGLVEMLGTFDNVLSSDVKRFPPTNIIKLDENRWVVELAVAGYGENDLTVTLEKSTLKVKGEIKRDESLKQPTYIKRGIALRNFEDQIQLPEGAQVDQVELINGLLRITVSRQTVELEVKQIPINVPGRAIRRT